MKRRNFVRGIAGTVIVGGFLLGWFVSKWFFLIDLFAGLNLLQSCKTGVCPPEMFHARYIREEVREIEEEAEDIL